MANQKADKINVDPDGDVIFICTYSAELSLRLRVSAKVVGLASPVFRAMLSPHFREGTSLATASYVEIELPEDDPDIMKLLFLVMHSKNHVLPSQVNLKALIETVDKYDCVTAVATAAYYWIAQKLEGADDEDLRGLLHDAYLLRQHQHFATIARKLVLESEMSIGGEPGVLTNVYSGLENERMKALLALSAAVQDHVLTASNIKKKYSNGCLPTCSYQDSYALAVLRRLVELKLWPGLSPRPVPHRCRSKTSFAECQRPTSVVLPVAFRILAQATRIKALALEIIQCSKAIR